MSRRGIGSIVERVKMEVVGVKLAFQIRLVNQGGKTTFFVDDPDLGIKVQGEDLSAVRYEAKKAAEGSIRCDWEDFVEVKFSVDQRYSRDPDRSIELSFDWTPLQIGTRGNGSKCWRNTPDGESWRTIKVNEGEPEGSKDDESVSAIIAATPENMAALEKFSASLKSIGAQFLELFAPKQAATSLLHCDRVHQEVFDLAVMNAIGGSKKKVAKKKQAKRKGKK